MPVAHLRVARGAILLVKPAMQQKMAVFVAQGHSQPVAPMALVPELAGDYDAGRLAAFEKRITEDLVLVVGEVGSQIEVAGVALDEPVMASVGTGIRSNP